MKRKMLRESAEDLGRSDGLPGRVPPDAPQPAKHLRRPPPAGRLRRIVGRIASLWVLALAATTLVPTPVRALPGDCAISGPGTESIDLVPCPQENRLGDQPLAIPEGLLRLKFCGEEIDPPAEGMLGRWEYLSSMLAEVVNGNGSTEPGIEGVEVAAGATTQGLEVRFREDFAGRLDSCEDEPNEADAKYAPTLAMGREGYTLATELDENGGLQRVVITALDHQGLFYGAMTLLQLLEEEPGALRPGEVRDFPNLERRAVSSENLVHFTVSTTCKLSLSEIGRANIRRLARLKINQARPQRATKVCAEPGQCDTCPYYQDSWLNLTSRGNWNHYRDGWHDLQKGLAQNFIQLIPHLDDVAGNVDKSDLAGLWIDDRAAFYASGTPNLIYNGNFAIDRDGIGGHPGWGGPQGPDGWAMRLDSNTPDQVGEWQYDPSTARMQLVLEEGTAPGKPFLSQNISYPGPGTYTLRVRTDGQATQGTVNVYLRGVTDIRTTSCQSDENLCQASCAGVTLKPGDTEKVDSGHCPAFATAPPGDPGPGKQLDYLNVFMAPCSPDECDAEGWSEGFALDSVEVFFEPDPPSEPLIGEVLMAPTMPFGGNLIANPSFEDEPGPGDWQIPTGSPGFWNLQTGPEFAGSGDRTLRLQCRDPTDEDEVCTLDNGFSIKASQQGPVAISGPGTWVLSFRAHHEFAGEYLNVTLWPCGRTAVSPEVTKPSSIVRIYPGSSGGYTLDYATSVRLTTEDFEAGARCSDGEPSLVAIYPRNRFGGEVHFDDFVLRQIDNELVEGRPTEFATDGIIEVTPPVVTDQEGNAISGIVSIGSWSPGRAVPGGTGDLGYDTGSVPMRLFATATTPPLNDGEPLKVAAEQYVQQDGLQGEGVYCDDVRMAKWIREFIDNDLYPGGTLDFPLPVRMFFLTSDEIRGMNQGRPCRLSDTGEEIEFDNGNLLARYYGSLAGEILKHDPLVRFVTENDMFSLFNNGGVADYQEFWRGPYGASVCAIENAAQTLDGGTSACDPEIGPPDQEIAHLPKEIEHVSWGYDSRLLNQNVRRVRWFNEAGAGRGKLTYGMPSFNNQDGLHYDHWSAIARGDRVMRGLMDYKIEAGGDPLYASMLLAEASWHAPWEMVYFGGFDEDLGDAILKKGVFETDYARTAENPFVLTKELNFAEAPPRCAANASVKSGTLGGICAKKGKIQLHSPVIEVPSQLSQFRVTFDADLAEGAILEIRPYWQWRPNRFKSCGWIRSSEEGQSGFHNYQFDFSPCIKRNKTYDAMYLKIRIKKSPDARLDNLSVWRRDPPCFDCPNPKFDQDNDGVADVEDNCIHVVNGPLVGFDIQADYDQDGFGNACDSDYDQNGTFASSDDIALLDSAILSCIDDPANCVPGPYDITGDGTLTSGAWVGDDFWTAAAIGSWSQYGVAPASGLSCADPLLDVKAGDPGCTAP